MVPTPPSPTETLPPARRWMVLAVALPAVAALLAYAEVHEFGFVFDDQNALVDSDPLHAGDWRNAAFGKYTSLANRPIACLSFAIDFGLGLGPGAMHVVNLVLHAINATLLFVVVRALLQAPNVRGLLRSDAAMPCAAVAATLWAVHPLNADAVAYLTQRSMLFEGWFALAAMAALLRSHGPTRRLAWQVATVVCTALALASKEEAAALPLLLLLAERAFCVPSWAALRPRWRFHTALAATWCVLLACVALGPKNPTVGYGTNPPVSAFENLLTQAGIVLHYLGAVVWPTDLRGVYDFAVVRTPGPALLPGALLIAALLGTAWSWRRRPWLGFLGAWFFLLLAPTSSIYPILTEPCADRRMYLPLLALVVPAAVAAQRALGTKGLLVAAFVAAGALGWQTRAAARIYRDDAALLTHAAATNDLQNDSFMAGRILGSLAKVLHDQGHHAEAQAATERAMRCEAPGPIEVLNLANLRQEQGRLDESETLLRRLVGLYPDLALAKGNLGGLLVNRSYAFPPAQQEAMLDEAERLLVAAVAQAPRQHEILNTMGVLLHTRGRTAQAVPFLQRSLAQRPDFAMASRNLGIAYAALGKVQDALLVWTPLLPRLPADADLRVLCAEAQRTTGAAAESRRLLQDALRIDPNHGTARELLRQLDGGR